MAACQGWGSVSFHSSPSAFKHPWASPPWGPIVWHVAGKTRIPGLISPDTGDTGDTEDTGHGVRLSPAGRGI